MFLLVLPDDFHEETGLFLFADLGCPGGPPIPHLLITVADFLVVEAEVNVSAVKLFPFSPNVLSHAVEFLLVPSEQQNVYAWAQIVNLGTHNDIVSNFVTSLTCTHNA